MTASRWFRVVLLVFALAPLHRAAAGTPPAAPSSSTAIRGILQVQADAWNRGDLDAFMQTYAPVDDLRFASGGNVTYGWQPTLERYKQRYPDRAAMGALTFSELTVTELSPDAALVFGHWQLTRTHDTPPGLFTLLVRRTPAGWKIFSDHTSSAAP